MSNHTINGSVLNNTSMGCYATNPFNMLEGCVFPQLTDATMGSDPMFGLLIGSVIIGSGWLAGDSGPGPPAILVILLGGALLPMLPGNFQGTAWALIIVGIAGAILAVGHRYVMNPGVNQF